MPGSESALLSGSDSGRYMLCVQGSSRLGKRNARSPTAITRLLRIAGSTLLQYHLCAFKRVMQKACRLAFVSACSVCKDAGACSFSRPFTKENAKAGLTNE